jgi:hypothetical protein
MGYKNMTYLLLIFGVGLTILGGLTVNCSTPQLLSDGLSNRSNPGYAGVERSRKSILKEMSDNGWLSNRYSEWFVSPNGSVSGTGKIDSPGALEAVLFGGDTGFSVEPGDIIWLRGGVYRGSYTIKIGGSSQRPIHIRQYPGERAILDKSNAGRKLGTLNVRSSFVWFWDFEVANSFANRNRLDPKGKLSPWRGSGVNVWAPHTKYINLIVRDNGHGFGVWNEEGETEIYGCLIFNNGNNKKEHGVYAHNRNGRHRIANNIIFNNSGYGLHIYANSVKRSISGFDIDNNTIFENGSLMNEDQVADQILVGGVEGVPARRIRLRGNVVYTDPEATSGKSRGIRLGFRHKGNLDVTLHGNLVVGRVPLRILWWNSVEACGNTIVSTGKGIEIRTRENADFSKYKFAKNHILSNGEKDRYLTLDSEKTTFDQWYRKIDHGDCGSPLISGASSRNLQRIFVSRNRYDSTRANVTIYDRNWTGNATVDLKGFLKRGESFSVVDAQNYFGEPVLTGMYDGKPVRLPLAAGKTTRPLGRTEQIPNHTGKEFSVYVVRKMNL